MHLISRCIDATRCKLRDGSQFVLRIDSRRPKMPSRSTSGKQQASDSKRGSTKSASGSDRSTTSRSGSSRTSDNETGGRGNRSSGSSSGDRKR